MRIGECSIRSRRHASTIRSSTRWREARDGLVDDYRAVGAHEWDFRTDAVTAPVTIWQGEADAAVPVSVGRRLAGLFGVQPRLVPDAGHFLVLEHGEEIFTDLIRGAAG